MRRPLSKRESKIFIFCIFMIFIYVSYQFVYKPIEKKSKVLEGKIFKTQRRLKKNTKVLQRESVVQKKHKKYIVRFKQSLSNQEEMNRIFSEVEKVARESNVKIIDMKPNKIKEIDFYKVFSVNIQTQGSMDLISKFLYVLESDPYYFRIDEMNLEKRSTRTSYIKCRIVVSRLLIHSQK